MHVVMLSISSAATRPHLLAPSVVRSVLLAQTAHALLGCSSEDVAGLFLYVPPNLTEVRVRFQDCRLVAKAPRVGDTTSMWRCTPSSADQSNRRVAFLRPPETEACHDGQTACEFQRKEWCNNMFIKQRAQLHERRAASLAEGLQREARLEKPTTATLIALFLAPTLALAAHEIARSTSSTRGGTMQGTRGLRQVDSSKEPTV